MPDIPKATDFGFGMFGWKAGENLAKKFEEAQKDPKTAFKGWSGNLYDYISPYLAPIFTFLSSFFRSILSGELFIFF